MYPPGGELCSELIFLHGLQTFILDLRDNHSKDHLLDDVLADCQGPAIIGVNDSIFKEKDWIALTNVHQSSKAQDET